MVYNGCGGGNMGDPLWALFNALVLEGLTLRAIRGKITEAGHDLSEYDDASLICKMIDILQGGDKSENNVLVFS